MRRLLIATALSCLTSAALADQKNIQVLTGLSDLELQRAMNMVRSSLGVGCDYCHVVNEKGIFDYPNDAKKEKETARDMMQMTEKLNREQFAGRAMVSCNTCHRGSVDPVALVPLPQTLPPRSAPRPARPPLPTLQEVVKRYTIAIGDVSRLQSPRVMQGTREGSDGKPLPFTIEQSGSKLHIAVTTTNGTLEQWADANGGWTRDARGVQKFTRTQLENFRQLTSAYAPVLPSAIPENARVIAKQKTGDHETVLVAVRVDEKMRERLYFDESTGLLVRRVIIRDTPIGPIPQQTDFDDYRDVGGTKFPFTIRLSLVDPLISSTRHYQDVQLGAKVEDAVFAPPAEPQ